MPTTFVPSTEPISNRDKQMLSRAVEIAKQSTMKQKHGALIYKAGKVLAVGVNSQRNFHPTMEIDLADYTYHAELSAYRALGVPHLFSGEGTTLYIARVNRRGTPVMSAPCEGCLWFILNHGIKRVVFTA